MIIIREAEEKDIPAIFEVRTSVRENHLSIEQMAQMGITPQSVLEALHQEPCIWVAEDEDRIVGFSMGNAEDACVFALFVHPACEGRGIGRRLLERAEAFLLERSSSIWLHTNGSSRAAGFYERLGWKRMQAENGDTRFEKQRPS